MKKTDDEMLAEIKAKFGTKAIKSGPVFVELSPKHLDVLRRKGVKLAFGYYSLEVHFGEATAATALPDSIKTRANHGEGGQLPTRKEPVSAPKQARVHQNAATSTRHPTTTANIPKRTSYHDLTTLREDFETAGFPTKENKSGTFLNEFGRFGMANGVLYRDNKEISTKELGELLKS